MDKSASVEDYILTSIRNQRWKPGEKMPAEPEMCRELGVSITTLRIALKTLANRGVIIRRRGAGSFVAKDLQVNKVILFVNFESLSLSSGFLYRALITHLKEWITARGFTPVLGIAPGNSREEFFANIQFERRDDIDEFVGAIALFTCPPKIRRLMRKNKIPLIELSGIGFRGESYESDGNHVYIDSRILIRQGLEAMQWNGIRDYAIFYIHFSKGERNLNREFFSSLLEERGITPDEKHLVELPWSWDRHEAYEEFIRWWNLPGRPEAVFFTEDNICKEALHAIWELGIRIPQDLSVITHSNSEKFHSPATLTLVEFKPDKIAGILFQAMEQLLSGTVPEFPILIEPVLIPGSSLIQPTGISSQSPRNGIAVTERLVYRQQPVRSEFGCWKSETGYCFSNGAEMFEVNCDVSGNDRYDCYTERFSTDDGETWGVSREVFSSLAYDDNIHRYCELFQNLDINSNSLYRLYLEGTYENDSDNWKGMESFRRNFRLCARRSFDGGRTFSEADDLTRLYQDIMPGKGRPMISCSHLLSLSDGSIIIPMSAELTAMGETSVCMLHGRNARNGSSTRTAWTISSPIPYPVNSGDFRLTEGTVAELPDGRLLALHRADSISNHGGNAPWNKFISVSEDGGHSWSTARPLCYADGSAVCSPCSMPRLWLHPCGRLFFIGNIWSGEVELMRSRNTLSILEIDIDTLQARPETLTRIDGHNSGDHPHLALSNFTVTGDRRTDDILVYCPKAYIRKVTVSDCVLMRYRISIKDYRTKGSSI